MKAPFNGVAAVVCVGFLALLGCSKTQDTAPETRLFGDPPVIQSVDVRFDTNRIAMCDFTIPFLFPREANRMCSFFPIFTQGGITLEARYTEVVIEATVTDPNDPAPPSTETDVLLVSASYVVNSGSQIPDENTIVMFDDGSQIAFPFDQKSSVNQACTPSTFPLPTNTNSCNCTPALSPSAHFNVTSNDLNSGDNVYSRHFAFFGGGGISGESQALFRDCVASANHQATQVQADISDSEIEFRVEAVDRSGNLTEFPARFPATIGAADLSCTGDLCACCLLLNTTNPTDPAPAGCFGLPGLMFDPNRKICSAGDASLRDTECFSNVDCDGSMPGTGRCDQTSLGRACPGGFCQSNLCLRDQ